MKKLLSLLLCVMMLFYLFACGSVDESSKQDNRGEQENPTSQEEQEDQEDREDPDTEEDPDITTCDHSLDATQAKKSTCTESGNIAYWTCSKCGKHFSNAEATEEIAVSAVVIPANGHKEETLLGYAPTYDATGLTDGKQCSVCGTITIAQVEIPKNKPSYYTVIYYDNLVNGYPKPEQYAQNTNVTIPKLSQTGYEFKGWYTGADGTGEEVAEENIQNYIEDGHVKLYAYWELYNYDISYEYAPVHDNPKTYTMEDEIVLRDPEWTGLIFENWTDENGDVITKIGKGNTEDVKLTANWKYAENITTTAKNKSLHSIVFDDELGRYHFIYEIGIIDNVVLKIIEAQDKAKGEMLKWTTSEAVTVGKDIADTVSETVSHSVSQTKGWNELREWVDTHNTSASVTGTIGTGDASPVKIESSVTGSLSSGSSSSKEYGYYGSEDFGSEFSNSVSSMISFSKSTTTTITTETSISAEMPAGTYSNVCVGKVHVYAIVTYDPIEQNYYIDTFSLLDKTIRGKRLYEPFSNSTVNISYSEGFDLTFITDNPDTETLGDGVVSEIVSYVESAPIYYVKYDANGGTGDMPTSVFRLDETMNLPTNNFSPPAGYKFGGGWAVTAGGGVLYPQNAEIKNLASEGETITLYAQWIPIPYTVSWSGLGVGYSIAVKRTESPSGASIGVLNSGDNVYYGDKLKIIYTAHKGYTLCGSGVTEVIVTENVTDISIWAKAEVNSYKISYDPNGGNGTPFESGNIEYDDQISLTTNTFTRENYVFLGWSTEPESVLPEYEDKALISGLSDINGRAVTLYAVWLKIKATAKTDETLKYDFGTQGILKNTVSKNVTPNLDRELLKEMGYTSLKVTVTIYGRGANVSAWEEKPYCIVYSYTDEQLEKVYLGSFSSDIIGNEEYKTNSVTFSIDNVNVDGSFWIKFGGDYIEFAGAVYNGYYLLEAEIEVEAIK